MNIGDKIRLLRTQKNITVNKLATLSGISQSFLRDIELGNKNLPLKFSLTSAMRSRFRSKIFLMMGH